MIQLISPFYSIAILHKTSQLTWYWSIPPPCLIMMQVLYVSVRNEHFRFSVMHFWLFVRWLCSLWVWCNDRWCGVAVVHLHRSGNSMVQAVVPAQQPFASLKAFSMMHCKNPFYLSFKPSFPLKDYYFMFHLAQLYERCTLFFSTQKHEMSLLFRLQITKPIHLQVPCYL